MTAPVVRRSVVALAHVVALVRAAVPPVVVIARAVRSATMAHAVAAGAALVVRAADVRPATATGRVAPLAMMWVDRAHSGMATAVGPRVRWTNHASGVSAGNASSIPAVRVEEMTNEAQCPGVSRGLEGRQGRPGNRRGVVAPMGDPR